MNKRIALIRSSAGGEHPARRESGELKFRASPRSRRRPSDRYSASTLWTSWMQTEPSPTAAATRLTLPDRMSPTAKTAGTFVSKRNGAGASSHLAATITAVRVAPLLHGFFAVEESDPDGVFPAVWTQEAREFQHQGCGGTSVIRADKIVLQPSVVVRAEKNAPGLFAGNLHEKVLPFFQNFPLQGVKRLDYLDWCKVADLIKNQEHLTE